MKNTNIRFYEDKEADKKAWEILHELDKSEFKSQSEFVVCAINDYYKRYMKKKEDPYLETREKEDAFIERIVNVVEEKVLTNFPAMIRMSLFQMQEQTNEVETGQQLQGQVLNETIMQEDKDEFEENQLLDFDFFG